ncbi:hypothetical protein BDC45DRAFT_556161 [Circinella umbellata]|nr:hypothetical protein BDC45DRAFT_556161 [Circinella umbellata]
MSFTIFLINKTLRTHHELRPSIQFKKKKVFRLEVWRDSLKNKEKKLLETIQDDKVNWKKANIIALVFVAMALTVLLRAAGRLFDCLILEWIVKGTFFQNTYRWGNIYRRCKDWYFFLSKPGDRKSPLCGFGLSISGLLFDIYIILLIKLCIMNCMYPK